MNSQPTERIFGFDVLRTLAILLVVIEHSGYLINKYTNFPFISLPDGVDLFFVLSGYLVGNILIKIFEKEKKISLNTVFNFLQRRWFRTLPNYFLFLVLNILLIYFGIIKGVLNKYLITYFVFFQNFHKPYDFLFWESWSLSIEEWFYLLFPLIILLLSKVVNFRIKTKSIVLTTIMIFLTFPLVYRLLIESPSLDFDLYIRKLVLTRLDTIGFGLLAAYLHWYYNSFWTKSKNLLFIFGLLLTILLLNLDIKNILFMQTYYYSIIGLSIFLLLPKLESLKIERIPYKPFQLISKVSYSMYLVHLPLLQIISKYFSAQNQIESNLIYLFFWIVLIALSYAIYRFYEYPIMNIRDRIVIGSSRN